MPGISRTSSGHSATERPCRRAIPSSGSRPSPVRSRARNRIRSGRPGSRPFTPLAWSRSSSGVPREAIVDQLWRLSGRIAAGDVVFFVGAGFSLDSEHNSTGILIARLLARFEAVAEVVARTEAPDTTLAALCAELRLGLRTTF